MVVKHNFPKQNLFDLCLTFLALLSGSFWATFYFMEMPALAINSKEGRHHYLGCNII